jgi:hypothetical protein
LREVPVGRRGEVAQVDDADFDLVSQYTWARCLDHRVVYAARNWQDAQGRRHRQRMHTLITGWPKVDHEDHDGLNNQRYNLREVTDAQNQWNRRANKGCSSEYKGVHWHRVAGKWRARIRKNRVWYELGFFDDERLAARAYDVKARELFGVFACLNFPE